MVERPKCDSHGACAGFVPVARQSRPTYRGQWPSAVAAITALSIAAVVTEIGTEGARESVERITLPRRCSLANEIRDLPLLTAQVLKPRVDQLKLDRREIEGIDADVKLVRAMRSVVPNMRMPVKERCPVVRWSMRAVPFEPGCVTGVWIVRSPQPIPVTASVNHFRKDRPPCILVERAKSLNGAIRLRRR